MAITVIHPQAHKLCVDRRFLSRVTLQDSKYKNLYELVQTTKLGLAAYTYTIEGQSGYLFMCYSRNDELLCRLAKDCGMPRGFPIIYIPKSDKSPELFLVGGFYPKFQNDDGAVCGNVTALSANARVSGTLKYSGFLGGILPFRYLGHDFVIYTSKNATGNIYSDALERIMAQHGMAEIVTDLCDKERFFYVECLSKTDMMHGYALLREGGLVTCMGTYRNIAIEEKPIGNFVCYLSTTELQRECIRLGLYTDLSFTCSNASAFMSVMETKRDTMTYSTFRQIIADPALDITITYGTITYDDFVPGDILEGVVLKVSTEDATDTVKYKFAKYTIRTMLYRPFLDIGRWNPESFLSYWCNSESGRTYWRKRASAFYGLAQDVDVRDKSCGPAAHILLADKVDAMSDEELACYASTPCSMSCTVVLVMGPIGCGKSTVAQLIADRDPARFRHVDGDCLGGLTTAETLKLRGERNAYTVSVIIKTIMQGFIPVISTGGGAVVDLSNAISRALGYNVEYIIYIPDNLDVSLPAFIGIHSQIERQAQQVREITIRRLETGEWTKDPRKSTEAFIQDIVSRSQKNLSFIRPYIVARGWPIYRFPYVTPETRNQLTSQLVSLPTVTKIPSATTKLMAEQGRLLVFVNKLTCDAEHLQTGHITLFYNKYRIGCELECIGEELSRITITGELISLQKRGIFHPSKCIKVAIPNTRLHMMPETAHVTIDTGGHKASNMSLIAQMRLDGRDSVIIDRIMYEIVKVEPVSIQLLDYFYI